MPQPTVLQPSISREEADRQQKEREKQRAPRISVVPNLAHFVQDNPSASYTHVSPIGQSEPVVAKSPATATIAPPKPTLRLAPAVPSPVHQPNQDRMIKQRERNARPTAVVSNQAEDLLRARFEAATLAMSENLKQEDFDQLLEEDRQQRTTYQTYRQQQQRGESVFLEQGSSEMGRRKRPSSKANGRTQANLDPATPPDLTPGAVAVSDGVAQRLNKAVLTRVETTNAPDYVAPVGHDAFESPRTQGIYGTIHPMDQQIPRESENVIQGQSVMKINETEYNTTHPRRKWYIVGAAVLIVIIVIAFSVALVVGGKRQWEQQKEARDRPLKLNAYCFARSFGAIACFFRGKVDWY